MSTKLATTSHLLADMATTKPESVRQLGDAIWQYGEYLLYGGSDEKDLTLLRQRVRETLDMVLVEPVARY